ncbi:hypothetical protein [Pseudonocardia alni]|uniref:hypothetical protein n=1 Tax=Pseudonocardia alni TaxID=33907 RepID=UPI0027A8DF23|nr:hypothetical protein PaSha_24305 [Pseudonocardia alni]
MDTDAELDRLYRVPPEDFVAARDDAAARARAAADTDAAREIAAARRPTRAAWLANLLVDDARDEVEGLLALAPVLAHAQRSSTARPCGRCPRSATGWSGRWPAGPRPSAAPRGPVGPGVERDVRWVLESALADPDLADRVRSGRLERYERHSGFGPLGEAGSGAAGSTADADAPRGARSPQPDGAARAVTATGSSPGDGATPAGGRPSTAPRRSGSDARPNGVRRRSPMPRRPSRPPGWPPTTPAANATTPATAPTGPTGVATTRTAGWTS